MRGYCNHTVTIKAASEPAFSSKKPYNAKPK